MTPDRQVTDRFDLDRALTDAAGFFAVGHLQGDRVIAVFRVLVRNGAAGSRGAVAERPVVRRDGAIGRGARAGVKYAFAAVAFDRETGHGFVLGLGQLKGEALAAGVRQAAVVDDLKCDLVAAAGVVDMLGLRAGSPLAVTEGPAPRGDFAVGVAAGRTVKYAPAFVAAPFEPRFGLGIGPGHLDRDAGTVRRALVVFDRQLDAVGSGLAVVMPGVAAAGLLTVTEIPGPGDDLAVRVRAAGGIHGARQLLTGNLETRDGLLVGFADGHRMADAGFRAVIVRHAQADPEVALFAEAVFDGFSCRLVAVAQRPRPLHDRAVVVFTGAGIEGAGIVHAGTGKPGLGRLVGAAHDHVLGPLRTRAFVVDDRQLDLVLTRLAEFVVEALGGDGFAFQLPQPFADRAVRVRTAAAVERTGETVAVRRYPGHRRPVRLGPVPAGVAGRHHPVEKF